MLKVVQIKKCFHMAQDNSWTIESVFFYFIKKVQSLIFRNSDFVFIDTKINTQLSQMQIYLILVSMVLLT